MAEKKQYCFDSSELGTWKSSASKYITHYIIKDKQFEMLKKELNLPDALTDLLVRTVDTTLKDTKVFISSDVIVEQAKFRMSKLNLQTNENSKLIDVLNKTFELLVSKLTDISTSVKSINEKLTSIDKKLSE